MRLVKPATWLMLFVCFLGWQFHTLQATAQVSSKRPLEHEDYDLWNSISGTTLSRNGDWVVYSTRDGKDKSTLKIRSLKSTQEFTVENGAGPRISYDSKHVAYRITPDKELVKKLKKEKKPDSEIPQEKFELLNLESGSHFLMEQVQSFQLPEKNGDWIAILLKKPEDKSSAKKTKIEPGEKFEITPEGLKRPRKSSGKKSESKNSKEKSKSSKEKMEKTAKAKKGKSSKSESTAKKDGDEDDKDKKKKKDGATLILKNLKSGVEQRIPLVTSYRFDELGKRLAYATSSKEDGGKDGVGVVELEDGATRQIVSGQGNYKNLVFDKLGTQLAFITDRDDYETKHSSWSVYRWKKGQSESKLVATEGTDGVPEDWWVSSTASPFFAESGKYLFCYTAPKPDDLDDDEEDEEPKAKLDLWHWQDPVLQPQQLLQAQQEKDRSYLAAYNLRSKKLFQLADKTVPSVFVDAERKSDVALGVSTEKYRKSVSWDMPGYRDVYLVNIRTGEKKMVLERIRSNPQLSPDGEFMTWWDTEDQHWMALSVNPGSKPRNLTGKIEFPLYNELHDTPNDPAPYGVAGWTTGDKAMLIYDRFDIWSLDPNGSAKPKCVTDSVGRETQTRFRFRQLDSEARSIDPRQPMLLSAFDMPSKDSGFYWLRLASAMKDAKGNESKKGSSEKTEQKSVEKILMLPEQLGGLQKSQDADRVVFTRSTFQRFPDIWASDTDFKTIERISEANPQQDDYAWGTVELTKWSATDGQEIDGLLYKPDDFDPSQKYPLMVYFYERNSDNLHRHHVPAAGRSIINFSFYVSRGYVVFVPDIPYKTGEPGPSAANAVLPGVQHVVDMGFIDEKRIGTQGHSWGGYQTAYLVTQTDIFACAESGAPVSNMTSAYGGIRWSSGLSRMFQYERTQSRIGDTLWNAREKYIANSPLFFVDKINTPLLILHNDEDGAVPWYQGIEMFVAMRRLEKPAWLLNYNGNPHWVMGRENRLDFAKRMQQFFDHYLKDEPMPEWMATGVPAINKGKDFGFEFVEEEAEAKSEESEKEEASEE